MEIYHSLDAKIHEKIKLDERDYVGNNTSIEGWSDRKDEDEDFREDFQQVYNDRNVPEANEATPEVLDNIYLNMEVALSIGGKDPEYARVTKRLRDANKIQLGPPTTTLF